MNAPEHASTYEIRVLGALDAHWSAWFADLTVSCNAAGETTLTGPLRDQAELYGVLARARDLGLPLIAVHRLDDNAARARESHAVRYPPERYPPERTPQMSHDPIPDVVRRWAEAESRSDADALDALMTDDCTLVGPAGFVLNRQQCLDRYRAGGLKTTAFDWSDVNVVLGFGDERYWLKLYRGKIVDPMEFAPLSNALGYDFTVSGELDAWKELKDGKTKFWGPLSQGRITIEGNLLEANRMHEAICIMADTLQEV